MKFDDFHSPAPVRENGEWAALLVSEDGLIRNMSPRLYQLLGGQHDALCGQPLRRILPRIPIRPRTPGYNRAFTAFWQNRRGLRQQVLILDNETIEDVETMLYMLPQSQTLKDPMIMVGLRFPRAVLEAADGLPHLLLRAENDARFVARRNPNPAAHVVAPAVAVK